LHLERTDSLNTDPLYMEALSETIYAGLERKLA
jgi:ferrochelatase